VRCAGLAGEVSFVPAPGQAGMGSALRRQKALVSARAHGQALWMHSVAVRAWKVRRAATCSRRLSCRRRHDYRNADLALMPTLT